ncbi:uncharacterized protein LOC116165138 [Photinus pyralis]|uniref:uncharacterized protein LOC116165138 n=1 Tax=Photinus pyralis TaxID=7054 RepID=UPI001267751A|nr:uncharacterized protein LOC116165138 [Photinus pyralis]
MYGREIRSRLDLIKPSPIIQKNNWETSRSFEVNDRIAYQNYIQKDSKWQFGRIKQVLGKLHYLIETDEGNTFKRHTNQIRKIGDAIPKQFNPNMQITLPSFSDGTLTNTNNESNTDISNPVDTSFTNNVPICEEVKDTSKSDQNIDPSHLAKAHESNVPLRRSQRTRKIPDRLDL